MILYPYGCFAAVQRRCLIGPSNTEVDVDFFAKHSEMKSGIPLMLTGLWLAGSQITLEDRQTPATRMECRINADLQ